MVAQPIKTRAARLTPEDYFEIERTSEMRHEFVDGVLVAMAGESPEHNRIARDITVLLQNQFRGRPCESFMEGVRVRVSPTKFRYPDVIALCGEARFQNTRPKTLLNPGVLFEVLSDSTQSIDLLVKLDEYRRLDSVTDYVIIAQDEMRILHYARQSDGSWPSYVYTQPQDVVHLAALGVSMTLAEIYQSVPLPALEIEIDPPPMQD